MIEVSLLSSASSIFKNLEVALPLLFEDDSHWIENFLSRIFTGEAVAHGVCFILMCPAIAEFAESGELICSIWGPEWSVKPHTA